eukprot:CAMPEP_0183310050 /NCGR_PEP_ID=MMETSP0160_2-20130417/28567_1 /TAXON_ID=2839 ORGANISM="Odontella Sinensis, Strain Grunow 1884" /NCGR_SAMPLE_ID=MMETSP0160_2 /ASSEMBLY_ACC=CAM_ASM_000250 /LENGTH=223 /DNA_ID=CAMNT_0025474193 /DNA_START=556 /DNA_END=1224 /DNA_ORIENTATION=-
MSCQAKNDMNTTGCFNNPLSSPIFNPNDASSKAGCIFLRPKKPKSPPLLADEQSDSVRANSSNVARSSLGSDNDSCRIWMSSLSSSLAFSSVSVIRGFLQLAGLRLPRCFLSMCSTRTCSGPPDLSADPPFSLRAERLSRPPLTPSSDDLLSLFLEGRGSDLPPLPVSSSSSSSSSIVGGGRSTDPEGLAPPPLPLNDFFKTPLRMDLGWGFGLNPPVAAFTA